LDSKAYIKTMALIAQITLPNLLQLLVFRFRSNEDGDIGVRIFPERQEILIRGAGFRGVSLHGIRSADLEMRQHTDGFVEHHAAMVEDFLEFGRGFAALMRAQVSLGADIHGI
jgi:hypothetical protein